MTKLMQVWTAAGIVSLSQGGLLMVQALRANAKPQEAAERSGLTLRQVQRLTAMPQVRELVATTEPLIQVRVSRRVMKAFELIIEGATYQEAAEAAGIQLTHLRRELDRPEVDAWFRATTIAMLRAAVPLALKVQAELRAKQAKRPKRRRRQAASPSPAALWRQLQSKGVVSDQ
jgi:hypothetical protein